MSAGQQTLLTQFQDPQDPIPNDPSAAVDFGAFGLPTGGLEDAERLHILADYEGAGTLRYLT